MRATDFENRAKVVKKNLKHELHIREGNCLALVMNTWEMAALLKGKFNSVHSQQFIFYASLKGWLHIIFNLCDVIL